MKTTKILAIVVFALGLMVWPAPAASGAQYLTVNDQDVTSITLELGQSRTVEIVSNDGTSYAAYVGFDNDLVLGTFSYLETKDAAGNLANVHDPNRPAFYGYYVHATGFNPAPSAGVHFVFEYEALQVGETDVKLYNDTFTLVIDSVHITVIPLQPKPMCTAFTYQGRLMDANDVADGLYDFEFKLYDNADPVFAAQQGSTIDVNDLDVIDGYFTVELDFGSDVFDGDGRWLETAVRAGDSNDPNAFVTLGPRHEITPVPYALQTRGIFVDSSGNVGIGTTNPSAKLDVVGEGEGYFLALEVHGPVLVEGPLEVLAEVGVEGPLEVRGEVSIEGGVDVYGDAIFDTGNVGIGTTDPIAKLDVVGDVEVAGPLEVSGPVWVEGPFLVDTDVEVSGNATFDSGNVGIGTNYPIAKLDVVGDVDVAGPVKVAGPLDVHGNAIFDTGNVGIGTTSPEGKLEVSHDGTSHDFVVDSSSGNVGIGTTNPSAKLVVAGDVEVQGPLGVAGPLDVHGNAIFDYGNVGIGTASPQGKLEVSHDGAAHDLVVDSSTGNVGIGTTSPGAKLDVFGDVEVLGPLGVTGPLTVSGPVTVEDIRVSSNVGIRTPIPVYDLDVNGDIRAIGSVYYGGTLGNSDGTAYSKPDFVFEAGYDVMSTEQVEEYLERENHLPWMTSAMAEKKENGGAVDMTRMAFETVETAENLQIQVIELNKLIKEQAELIRTQQKRITALEQYVAQNETLKQRVEALERKTEQYQLVAAKEVQQ